MSVSVTIIKKISIMFKYFEERWGDRLAIIMAFSSFIGMDTAPSHDKNLLAEFFLFLKDDRHTEITMFSERFSELLETYFAPLAIAFQENTKNIDFLVDNISDEKKKTVIRQRIDLIQQEIHERNAANQAAVEKIIEMFRGN
jgi:hypothetical protein